MISKTSALTLMTLAVGSQGFSSPISRQLGSGCSSALVPHVQFPRATMYSPGSNMNLSSASTLDQKREAALYTRSLALESMRVNCENGVCRVEYDDSKAEAPSASAQDLNRFFCRDRSCYLITPELLDNNQHLQEAFKAIGDDSDGTLLVLTPEDIDTVLKALFKPNHEGSMIKGVDLSHNQCRAIGECIWSVNEEIVKDLFSHVRFGQERSLVLKNAVIIGSPGANFLSMKNAAEKSMGLPASGAYAPSSVNLGDFDAIVDFLGPYQAIRHVEIIDLNQA